MQQSLMDICNSADIVLISGNNVHNSIRNMLQMIKGEYTLLNLENCDVKIIKEDVKLSGNFATVEAVSSVPDCPNVVLASLEVFNQHKDKIKPGRRCRYWVWIDGTTQEDFDSDNFDATVVVRDGRIVSCDFSPVNRTYEMQRTENLGTWYAFIMTLFNDVVYRVSYQNLALLLMNIYTFIEYACAKQGEARNLSNARKVLGVCYQEILGDLFRLRLLFSTEPFNRKDIWEIMNSVLKDNSFYELLQLYFGSSYKELEELKQIRYIVAIEMDKEGL